MDMRHLDSACGLASITEGEFVPGLAGAIRNADALLITLMLQVTIASINWRNCEQLREKKILKTTPVEGLHIIL